jgi:hypothetical protein
MSSRVWKCTTGIFCSPEDEARPSDPDLRLRKLLALYGLAGRKARRAMFGLGPSCGARRVQLGRCSALAL